MFFMEPIDETFLQWIDIADHKGGKVYLVEITRPVLDIDDSVGGEEHADAVSQQVATKGNHRNQNNQPK